MDDETLHKYLSYLDGRSPKSERMAITRLEESGVDIPGLLKKRYEISRRWSDRSLCVSHCIEYAKTNEVAFQLGIRALQDKSRTVRRMACLLLSVAQRQEAVEQLEKLLPDDALKDDVLATLDALAKQTRN